MVDTTGLLLLLVVHTADIQDRDGARLVLKQV
jgi:putative transposase